MSESGEQTTESQIFNLELTTTQFIDAKDAFNLFKMCYSIKLPGLLTVNGTK